MACKYKDEKFTQNLIIKLKKKDLTSKHNYFFLRVTRLAAGSSVTAGNSGCA